MSLKFYSSAPARGKVAGHFDAKRLPQIGKMLNGIDSSAGKAPSAVVAAAAKSPGQRRRRNADCGAAKHGASRILARKSRPRKTYQRATMGSPMADSFMRSFDRKKSGPRWVNLRRPLSPIGQSIRPTANLASRYGTLPNRSWERVDALVAIGVKPPVCRARGNEWGFIQHRRNHSIGIDLIAFDGGDNQMTICLQSQGCAPDHSPIGLLDIYSGRRECWSE